MRVLGVMFAAIATACSAQAQVSQREPACRAERSGDELVTRIVFPDGYTVEAPWRVTAVATVAHGATITAVLDHIVETRPLSDAPQMTELPDAIQMTFRGRTMTDLLSEAAQVWCSTVLHTRPAQPEFYDDDPPQPNRIT
jgi:hypothetical protein